MPIELITSNDIQWHSLAFKGLVGLHCSPIVSMGGEDFTEGEGGS